ncbi:putative Secreted Protein [Cryptosporidium tyzzeri]|nr:putative Secreted Protein [Cryptosporidium tyzzeri]
MAGGSLKIINCLYFLLVSLYLFRFVISESSYLDDAEIIKNKIPGFIEMVSKNNIEMSEGDIEKVNEKQDRIRLFQNTPKPIIGIRTPTRPKTAKNLEEFNLPKVEIGGDNIELKLEEIKEKIKEIKDIVFDYNNTESSQESTPVLGYPTKFDHKSLTTEQNISYFLNTDLKAENLMKGLDLFDEEHNAESSFNKATASDQKKVLEPEKINRPNWKGSARHLIKSSLIKEEFYNKLDEEGRSVVAEFENTYKKPEIDELHYPDENIDSTKDPEDLSIQEKQLNSKLLLVNEIPSGEIMCAKNFSYEGEQHSNIKRKENALLSTFEQMDYSNFEEPKKDEIKKFSEEKNMKLNTKKKNNKNVKEKTKHKKILEKQDLSSPKLSPEPKNRLDRFQNSLTIPIGCKDKNKTLPKKYSKEYLKYGYDDLQFEIENTSLNPTLPSITTSMQNNPLKEGASYNSNLTLKLKKTLKKRDSEGYSEPFDIPSENYEDSIIPITIDTPFLQIIQHKMPKRSNKKLGSPIKSKLLNTKDMLRSEASSKTLVSDRNKDSDECYSEIFESSGTKNCEQTACVRIGDLICAPQNDIVKKINVPKSNLPKRKNR